MRLLYFTFVIACFPLFSNAQALLPDHKATPRLLTAGQANVNQTIKGQQRQKAFGDTIFYEDFDSLSVANNWIIVDSSGNATPWIWAPSGAAPGGQYTTAAALASATESNGYMLLPADLYNTPSPVRFKEMDTYFQSGPIDLRDLSGNPRLSVLASWQQSLTYCCSSSSELVIETSVDGVTWASYDAVDNLSTSTIWTNGSQNTIDLTFSLRGQDTAYVRFRSSGNTHFYWMIDDFILTEGPSNNLELSQARIDFHPDTSNAFRLQPQYYQVPLSNVSSMNFEATVFNGGGNTQSGSTFKVEALSDSLIGGGPGLGSVYLDSSAIGTGTIMPLATGTVNNTNPFIPNQDSHYTIEFRAESDSVDQQPSESIIRRPLDLTLNGTIALERGEGFFTNTSGPGAYAGSAGIGDAAAALMVLDTGVGVVTPTSISYYVPADRADEIDGLVISPRIWRIDSSLLASATINPSLSLNSLLRNVVCSPLSSITIDTCTTTCPPNQLSVMNTWVDLDISTCPLLLPGTYYFGFEQTGGIGSEIWGAIDEGAEEQATLWTNIMFLANSAGGWGYGGYVMGLRFNGIFPPPLISSINEVEESSLEFNLYPNPSEGIFNLELGGDIQGSFQVNVVNMLGQTTFTEAITVNGTTVKTIDLTHLEKGVYFVSLENGDERLVRKVVVK